MLDSCFMMLSNQSDDTENPTWQQGQCVFGGEKEKKRKEKKITPKLSYFLLGGLGVGVMFCFVFVPNVFSSGSQCVP